jgi:hypothetical protein
LHEGCRFDAADTVFQIQVDRDAFMGWRVIVRQQVQAVRLMPGGVGLGWLHRGDYKAPAASRLFRIGQLFFSERKLGSLSRPGHFQLVVGLLGASGGVSGDEHRMRGWPHDKVYTVINPAILSDFDAEQTSKFTTRVLRV